MIATVLGCPRQRCTVHFLRDMLGHVAKTQQPMIAAAIRGIFQLAWPRHVSGWPRWSTPAPAAPKVAGLLEAAEAELLAFYELLPRALVQAALHQPAGTSEPGDRPAYRRGVSVGRRSEEDRVSVSMLAPTA